MEDALVAYPAAVLAPDDEPFARRRHPAGERGGEAGAARARHLVHRRQRQSAAGQRGVDPVVAERRHRPRRRHRASLEPGERPGEAGERRRRVVSNGRRTNIIGHGRGKAPLA